MLVTFNTQGKINPKFVSMSVTTILPNFSV